ncbi:MAG: hypothetical protein KCHDKBKB_02867 [Elusimicrobia bacterium]|nr:hypothetical protein [Elusimicrobiota bacterium]
MELAEFHYGAFWRRAVGFLIDSVGYAVLFVLLLNVFSPQFVMVAADTSDQVLKPILGPLFFVFMWLYSAIWESSRLQASPGKWLMQVKVTDISGNQISFWRATARFWGKQLSLLIVVGFCFPFFTRRKQALHDLIARTLVVPTK